ncbi:hypothetical protein GCM10027612_68960 [Microbispora bryophytorum subsp. camponoti]
MTWVLWSRPISYQSQLTSFGPDAYCLRSPSMSVVAEAVSSPHGAGVSESVSALSSTPLPFTVHWQLVFPGPGRVCAEAPTIRRTSPAGSTRHRSTAPSKVGETRRTGSCGGSPALTESTTAATATATPATAAAPAAYHHRWRRFGDSIRRPCRGSRSGVPPSATCRSSVSVVAASGRAAGSRAVIHVSTGPSGPASTGGRGARVRVARITSECEP